MSVKSSRSPCFMRSDVYEDLRSYAESAGMKVYTLTNLLVETGLKMLKEGISPSEVLIMYKVLDTLTRFAEIKPKGGWRELGQALGTVLKGTFNERDLDMAVMKALEIVAMSRGSKSGSRTSVQFMFLSGTDAEGFEAFADSLIETTAAKLSVERLTNVVKVSYVQ
ncbi:hypothetical protein DDW06_02790 [Sulfolobales archaeon SCGC AB-777_K20]|nr:hypothetical protein DDW06_02790 [Sulfolobales archaeon SCGC AB-777_K20]